MISRLISFSSVSAIYTTASLSFVLLLVFYEIISSKETLLPHLIAALLAVENPQLKEELILLKMQARRQVRLNCA